MSLPFGSCRTICVPSDLVTPRYAAFHYGSLVHQQKVKRQKRSKAQKRRRAVQADDSLLHVHVQLIVARGAEVAAVEGPFSEREFFFRNDWAEAQGQR
jgi:hypothetical protein